MMRTGIETEIFEAGTVAESKLTYVVIGARFGDKWIFVRHRDRRTWEMPAGHIEKSEPADRAAERELFEEAGATASTMEYLFDYKVTAGGNAEYGRLYSAVVREIGAKLEYETVEIILLDRLPPDLTYPEVQTALFNRLNDHLLSNQQS